MESELRLFWDAAQRELACSARLVSDVAFSGISNRITDKTQYYDDRRCGLPKEFQKSDCARTEIVRRDLIAIGDDLLAKEIRFPVSSHFSLPASLQYRIHFVRGLVMKNISSNLIGIASKIRGGCSKLPGHFSACIGRA